MLIRFIVSNFLSFNEEREFNMLAGSFKTHKHHVYKIGKVDVLKAAAIYGANGAGKSNLIKAISFLQELIADGELSQSVDDKKFKLNFINAEKPVSFEIEFSIDNKIYSYGITLNHTSVIEEWLYESGITIEDKLIFERKQTKTGKTSIQITEKYKKTLKQKYLFELMEENLLKHNELLLGKTDTLHIAEISNVRDWLENRLIIIFPGSKFQSLVPAVAISKRFNKFVNNLLETFDTGVSELVIETTDFDKFFGKEDDKIKNNILKDLNKGNEVLFDTDIDIVLITKENKKYLVKKIVAQHKDIDGKKVSFDLIEESDGTQRL